MLGSVGIPSFSDSFVGSWSHGDSRLKIWLLGMTWLTWGAPQGTGGALWQFMLSIQQQPPPLQKNFQGFPSKSEKLFLSTKMGPETRDNTLISPTSPWIPTHFARDIPQVPGICNVKGSISQINHQWLIEKNVPIYFGNLVIVMLAVGCRKCKSLYQSYS